MNLWNSHHLWSIALISPSKKKTVFFNELLFLFLSWFLVDSVISKKYQWKTYIRGTTKRLWTERLEIQVTGIVNRKHSSWELGLFTFCKPNFNFLFVLLEHLWFAICVKSQGYALFLAYSIHRWMSIYYQLLRRTTKFSKFCPSFFYGYHFQETRVFCNSLHFITTWLQPNYDSS